MGGLTTGKDQAGEGLGAAARTGRVVRGGLELHKNVHSSLYRTEERRNASLSVCVCELEE